MPDISKQRNDAMCRRVVLYGCPNYADAGSHQCVTLAQIARKVAAVAGYAFAGAFETCGAERTPEAKALPFYFVPLDTVVGLDQAARLGIQGAADLFGGVVPFAFVSTKAITHGLVAPGAAAPEGWCGGFAERTQDAVLPGFTTFSREDAALAGRRLLEDGPVRLKSLAGSAGWASRWWQTLPRSTAHWRKWTGRRSKRTVSCSSATWTSRRPGVWARSR